MPGGCRFQNRVVEDMYLIMTSICLTDFALVFPSMVSYIHSPFMLQMSIALRSPWLSRAKAGLFSSAVYKNSSKKKKKSTVD